MSWQAVAKPRSSRNDASRQQQQQQQNHMSFVIYLLLTPMSSSSMPSCWAKSCSIMGAACVSIMVNSVVVDFVDVVASSKEDVMCNKVRERCDGGGCNNAKKHEETKTLHENQARCWMKRKTMWVPVSSLMPPRECLGAQTPHQNIVAIRRELTGPLSSNKLLRKSGRRS